MVSGELGWRCWCCGIIFIPFVNHPNSITAWHQGGVGPRGGSRFPWFIVQDAERAPGVEGGKAAPGTHIGLRWGGKRGRAAANSMQWFGVGSGVGV